MVVWNIPLKHLWEHPPKSTSMFSWRTMGDKIQYLLLNTYLRVCAVHIEQRHVTMRSLNHTQPPQEIEGLHAKRAEFQKHGSHQIHEIMVL